MKSEVNEIEIIVKDSHGVPVGKLLQQPVTLVIHLRAYPFYSDVKNNNNNRDE